MNIGAKIKSHFKDKVVVITGSSKGIGKATAIMFCEMGARVVLNGRNPESLQKSSEEMKRMGFQVFGIPADVSKAEESKELIDKAVSLFGSIDILINNAGISMRGNIDELEPIVFEKVFYTNFLGSVYPMIYALPYIKAVQGSVVFISSVAGIRGLPGLSAYCSSKMALRALTESMRFDLKSYNIHVGLIYVGFTENDSGKEYMLGDGSLKAIEPRDNIKSLSQTAVARAIVKNIYQRRYISVLSSLGKLNAFMQRFFPRIVEWALNYSNKKVNDMSK